MSAPDTVLTATPPEEVEDFVVSVLAARQDWLEVWTERLREWLADRVFGPLVEVVLRAHEPANEVGLAQGADAVARPGWGGGGRCTGGIWGRCTWHACRLAAWSGRQGGEREAGLLVVTRSW